MYLVYAIDCPAHDGGLDKSGQVYFGQTSQPIRRRLSCHSRINSPCKRLRNWLMARRSEGYAFRVQVLIEHISKQEADAIERDLIKSNKSNSLNITEGGGGAVGFRHSEESRRKISLAQTGRSKPAPTKETRAKLRVATSQRYGYAAKAQEIRMLYASGLSAREVALIIGCCKPTVLAYCKDIARRQRHGGE